MFEVVERKGVGHPDTIADAMANAYSREYSDFCMDTFGGVPRHSVDKIVLSRGTSDISFGRGEAVSPIECHIVGKLTRRFAGSEIPLMALAKRAWAQLSSAALTSCDHPPLLPIQFHLHTNAGIGHEHPDYYYAPYDASHLDLVHGSYDANDTSLVFGHASWSDLELLICNIENTLTSSEVQLMFGLGTDVKVLGIRTAARLALQVAVPFIATEVRDEADYLERLDAVRQLVRSVVATSPLADVALDLAVNTKDRPGHGYLTLAGSALDKGDQGAVGRGNNYSGVISMLRPQSMESHAGKNPCRSAGRLYPIICRDLSARIALTMGRDVTIGLQSTNGLPLTRPRTFALDTATRELVDGALLTFDDDDLARARELILSPLELQADLFGRPGSHVSVEC